jgi:hypothetical protein
MIASPGDVATERQLIRDVIHEWNAINAGANRLVLMPVGWESHASPRMGVRAQTIINDQVLKTCDLLVAVFWTRLGSPTGESPSGTVEEIREHVQAGKPAMIYFSQQPVRPDSVDDSQYRALIEFRSECRAEGLIEVYESLSEFREKFSRHLAQTVLREFSTTSLPSPLPLQPQLPNISDDALRLLAEASQDSSGSIIRIRTAAGLGFTTNGKHMAERGNPKSEARWEAALQELIRQGLLRQSDSRGEIFAVTHAGYNMVDNSTDRV